MIRHGSWRRVGAILLGVVLGAAGAVWRSECSARASKGGVVGAAAAHGRSDRQRSPGVLGSGSPLAIVSKKRAPRRGILRLGCPIGVG